MSRSEDHIEKILKQNKINFVKEKTFIDLHQGQFRFDFYIPSKKVIIEYDGEQHFYQVKRFQKTRQEFLAGQERDRQKNSYCLAHSIKLYRIPFWELQNIKNITDLFKTEFLVKDRWHNDDSWRKHKEN